MTLVRKTLIILALFSMCSMYTYSQDICFDGIYCPFPGDGTSPPDPTPNGCGSGGTDEYANVDFILDPDTDVGAGGTCDILKLFIVYEPNGNVYLSFVQANQGQACYSFYFDSDCDPTTGSNEDLLDPSDGIVLMADGADIRFLVCVQQDNVNDPEVETWDGTSWVPNGTNNISGLAGLTDGCSGVNEAFVETEIPLNDLLDVCDPANNACGELRLTTFLTYAGGSFNSQECDITFETLNTTIPASVTADLAPVNGGCTGSEITFDASGSTGSPSLMYEWDFDGDGVIDQTTTTPTVTNTYTTPGTYTVTVLVSDPNPVCPDAMPAMAEVTFEICAGSIVTCPTPEIVEVLEGESIDTSLLGSPTVMPPSCDPTFDIVFTDTSGPGGCDFEEIITRVFTITDACGVSECIQTINVIDIDPPMINAVLANPAPVCFGEVMTFDASGSTGFTDLEFAWDFDGDGVIDVTTTTPTTTNSYPNPGTYTVFVTVSAPNSPCPLTPATTSIEIIICDQITVTCPVATITIVDGESTDPIDLGEPIFTTNECNPNPTYTFVDASSPATCPFEEIIVRTFTITDNCGNQECVQTINVEVDNPADINALPLTPEICLGDAITLDASASIGDGLSYCWNVGNGNQACDYTTAIASHTYVAAGIYIISLTITDQYGCMDDVVLGTVTVYEAPELIAQVVFDPCTLILTYDASAAIDNFPPDNLIYTWDFGDGNTSGNVSGTHTYESCIVANTITITIVDPDIPFAACNSAQMVFTIETDTEPPVIVCPPAADLACGDPIPTYPTVQDFVNAGGAITDNCNDLTIEILSQDTIPGSCPYIYEVQVLYQVSDQCFNSAQCSQIFNLLPAAPSGVFPQDTVLSCGDDISPGVTGIPVVNMTSCTRPSTVTMVETLESGNWWHSRGSRFLYAH